MKGMVLLCQVFDQHLHPKTFYSFLSMRPAEFFPNAEFNQEVLLIACLQTITVSAKVIRLVTCADEKCTVSQHKVISYPCLWL